MHENPESPRFLLRSACLAASLALAAACSGGRPDATPAAGGMPGDAPASLPRHDANGCIPSGRFVTELYGALAGRIDWREDALTCEGMRRPEGRGARLRFAGTAGETPLELAIIISVPDLPRGGTGSELPSNVTIIEEGNGRFFSTSDVDSCWTDVRRQQPLGDARFAIEGRLYCIAPLAEVNGVASVTLNELEFTGVVDWEAS